MGETQMPLTEAQKKAKKKYSKKLKTLNIVFYPTEKELYEAVEKHTNKTGYIKKLIEQDIEKQKECTK